MSISGISLKGRDCEYFVDIQSLKNLHIKMHLPEDSYSNIGMLSGLVKVTDQLFCDPGYIRDWVRGNLEEVLSQMQGFKEQSGGIIGIDIVNEKGVVLPFPAKI